MTSEPKGRASTPEQKRAVIERLYASWVEVPEQRFGQLLSNALLRSSSFSIEDRALAKAVENFALNEEPHP